MTFAQPVVLGGVGSFLNTAHFLDFNYGYGNSNNNVNVNANADASANGFVGCIRRLEINNKIYAFEPAERGGDALFGVDIGIFCAPNATNIGGTRGGRAHLR